MKDQFGDSRLERLVLVVEDNDLCRASVVAMLKGLGFSVLEAVDGEQALQIFDSHSSQISVVLLDVVLPGMSGSETFKALRLIRKQLPIVLTSGYQEEFACKHFEENAYSGFIPKPGSGQTFKSVLLSAIDELETPV